MDRSKLPSVLLVAALVVAALVRPLRLPFAVVLLVAYVISGRRGGRSAAIAAALPVAAILAWGALGQPAAATNAAQCTDVLAPPGALLVERRASISDLCLRLGSRRVAIVAGLGALVVAPLALYASTWLGGGLLGGSFFGAYALDLTRPAALFPALVFAVSNAVAEELAYRGALRTWLGPSLGVVGANLGQAIVFGAAHSGADFVGPVLPTAIAMVLVGFIGGVIARRTGSLTLPIAIHAAADIPIYFFWACRLG